ncbi:pyruvate kinase [Anoxybacteroides amylolyticum]|uniref:Pyruvate kinase n=1 Tax=Anoxybacteroides amylolyticum TaxID=294699 RepID=A0A160F4Z3_9BACL|nr:pyruvate kinase [Anoxybacillus amylolyticus]ANB61151.1 pyruvate kinase, barrel domain protein [Anoxybacillus amylolyticus]
MDGCQSKTLVEMLEYTYQVIIERTVRKIKKFPLVYHEESRDNLLAYLCAKEAVSESLVRALEEVGLSLVGYESHVLSRLALLLNWLHLSPTIETNVHSITCRQAEKLMNERAKIALGETRSDRRTRIMVTLDRRMIHQPEMVEQLLLRGMDIARINCAYDTPDVWKKMIDCVREAEVRLKQKGNREKRCRIYMDLPGPKIRIKRVVHEKRPLKLAVKKTKSGHMKEPLIGLLSIGKPPHLEDPSIAFVIEATAKEGVVLTVGDKLSFQDIRGRKRGLQVIEMVHPTCAKVVLKKTAYLQERTILTCSHSHLFVRSFMLVPMKVPVQQGAYLKIYFDEASLESSPSDVAIKMTTTLPKAFHNVRAGHRLFIDDGKIFAIIQQVTDKYVEAKVVSTGKKPRTLKEGAGLNLPDSFIHLNVSSMTEKDREYIPFICQHADMIGLSFVHTPKDVATLQAILAQHDASPITVVAKIETRAALHNLARILLEGLKLPSFAVMIARGDLAIEVGFEHMSIVQQEILALCRAAHIPVIWATQVLESLAKKGLPARAEISDVSLGQTAQCIMLNKGTYILEAVKMLSKILEKEEAYEKRERTIARYMSQQGTM